DSDHRETEADIPIDSEKGLPHGHRTVPFSPKKIVALSQNIDWVSERDPYAGLIVSMHHTGLAQSRYNLIQSWQTGYGTAAPTKTDKTRNGSHCKISRAITARAVGSARAHREGFESSRVGELPYLPGV